MKNPLLAIVVSFATLLFNPSFAQTNTFPSSGNVGIGTTSPGSTLEVLGTIRSNIGTQFSAINTGWSASFGYSTGNYGVRLGANSNCGIIQVGQNATPFGLLIQPYGGNVGIGTTTPSYLLSLGAIAKGFAEYSSGNSIKVVNNNHSGVPLGVECNDASGFSGIEYLDNTGTVTAFAGYNNGNPGEFRVNNMQAGGFITFKINYNDKLTIANSGNVGISTISPGEKLDINGNMRLQGTYPYISFQGSSWGGTYIQQGVNSSGSTTGDYLGFFTPAGKGFSFAQGSVEKMIISSTGNVGIGTTSPSEKLAVNGNIVSRKVKVTQTGWSDYVFYKDYKLPALNEVEVYVKQHQHLPDIPSAKEVEKKGIDLGDNQAALLKKIEELTLYAIDQNKRLEQQQKEINELKEIVNKKH